MKNFVEKFAALIIGAFSLLAALAWNDTIKAFIQKYISPGDSILSMVIYATVITIIAVIVSIYLTKLVKTISDREDKLVKKIKELTEENKKCKK